MAAWDLRDLIKENVCAKSKLWPHSFYLYLAVPYMNFLGDNADRFGVSDARLLASHQLPEMIAGHAH